ncbi:hypothetical protein [Mucilaginibacter sp. PPCGB 2223]|uniref:hypothetical protein n=1 Tax=Mucilaginibacter sp. PPCGB 2223 TaxID=1886027 RepID=UPI001112A19E|nr:hypothetical protein [Mucilaginibacter sp. PPCGB 2223]
MSDKEFDQLFSAQLNDLEMEPSAGLWDKIVPEIPGSRKAGSGLAPMLSIAATLVILLTAGLLFMPHTQKLELHGNYDPQQTINDAVAAVTQRPSVTGDMPDLTAGQPATPQPQNVLAATRTMADKPETKGGIVAGPIDSAIVSAVPKVVNISKPEHQENVTKLVPVANTIASVTPKTEPAGNQVKALTANNIPAMKITEAVKKKKIHSLGDLLNVVIAKVDKRDNKIIQFGQNDDDEDELLNVTGVNLGPLKVKKQN